MAGTNPPGWNGDTFRTAIQAAMAMGQPSNVAQQVTFVWRERDTYSPEGPDDDPYSWTQTPTVVSPARTQVQVNCAVQYGGGGDESSAMGGFDATTATLTLLDEDYALVQGADQVLVGGITYVIEAPGAIPSGLFDVTIYTIKVSARA